VDGRARGSDCFRHDPRVSDALPDPGWYLDHVVVPTVDVVGPIRAWQAAWSARTRPGGGLTADASVRLAHRQGFALTRAQARATGMSDAEVRRLVRAGDWYAPHYGVVTTVRPDDERMRHALAASAAALVRPGHAISGGSAAVVHGLPLVAIPDRVVLTAVAPSRMGTRGRVLVRAAGQPVRDLTTWFGAPITTIARTIIDLARQNRAAGLVAADAALHERVVGQDELRWVASQCAGWPGARWAREIVAVASPLAESPLETLTRLCIVDAKLPVPELQVWIEGAVWRYRVDMLWREHRVIAEADGRVKYSGDELWREKRRQERLERAGFRLVRVLWDDVMRRRTETIDRISHALFGGPILA
jgi:hypothetical protein